MGGRSSVVAVGVQGDVIAWWTACVHGRTGAIAVFIGIGVERQQDAFVHEAVAVVVAAIADFGGRGVDPRSGVITVGPAGAVARAVDVAAERVGLPVEVRVAEAKGDLFERLRAMNPTVPATRRERMAQAELTNRAQIAEAQTGATLRGQDITAGTSRANTRDVTSATLRGQDMDYAEKMDAKRMDIAARMADRKLRGD